MNSEVNSFELKTGRKAQIDVISGQRKTILKVLNHSPLPGLLFFIHLLSRVKPYSLGKSERLKSRKQIDQLFKTGEKITLFPFRLLYKIEPDAANLRSGFTVSSKSYPLAVDRNRIKRLCREGYRIQKKELETMVQKNDCSLRLFFIYTAKEIISQKEISGSIKNLLHKLVKVIYEKNPANT